MLLPDVNICLHALRPEQSAEAAGIRDWLTGRLTGHEQVGLVEAVLASVVRIATHPRVFQEPSTPAQAVRFADALLAAPSATTVRPGSRHWQVFTELVATHRVRGNDVPDAYLAAVALEAGATIVTRDRGLSRYGVRLLDPLT
jgi:toxin-antitoxin system PIN domain toxin